MSAVEDEEETILEYAQYHGLAASSAADDSPDHQLEKLLTELEDLVVDQLQLYKIQGKAPDFSRGRLTVDKGSAHLIRHVNQDFYEPELWWQEVASSANGRKRKCAKLDTPLLKTDPDIDFKKFRAVTQEEYVFDSNCLPGEPLDDERDESTAWPSWMKALRSKIMDECEQGTIRASRDTVVLVCNALKDEWSDEEDQEMIQKEIAYTRNNNFETVTPPLSPIMEAVAELFVPSSPSFTLPVLSDPISLLSTDQDAVEQLIFEKDTLLETRNSEGDHKHNDSNEEYTSHSQYCPSRKDFEELESLPSSQLFPAPVRIKKDELRIDNGLTPPIPSSSSVQSKTVTFNEQVETMLLDEYYSDSEFCRPFSLNEELLKQDDELCEALKAASARVEAKLSREQLQEAVTTRKFHIPAHDDELPVLPWKKLEKQRFSKTLKYSQADHIADVIEDNQLPNGVPGLRKLQEGLPWSPFPPKLAQVALTEDIRSEEGPRAFLKLVAGENVTTSSDIISNLRIEVFRCLEDGEDDEDDELEPVQFVDSDEGKVDLNSLLRKRKRKLDDNSGRSIRQETASHGIPSPPSPVLQQHALNIQNDRHQGDKHHNLIGVFTSATTALDEFMEMRGKKKPKLTDSKYFGLPRTIAVPQAQPAALIPKALAVSEPKLMSMPLPVINSPNTGTPFIVSVTLMQLRPIIKVITALFPTAQLIERDFSKHNNSSWMKGTVKRSPVISSLDAEADLILSPSTGVIITTLAKIKQKPLPGQNSEVKIRARLNALSKRYSRVIVFVSEGNDNGTGILNGQDCMAFSDFVGFCCSKESTITVLFIPGGAQALGTWVTSAMIKHGIHDGSQSSLMEDETVWELFLRRCGMNAYAAQSVAAAMRAQEGVDVESPTKRGLLGLVGFVQMDHEERIRLFGAMLGGRRVLERVSAVIDTPWRLPTPVGQAPNMLVPNPYPNPPQSSVVLDRIV